MKTVIGRNIEAALTEDGKLQITLDLPNGRKEDIASKAGKSVVFATTSGNVSVATPEGVVKLGINAYQPING
tara:strand:+ start:849 stop:1064 length:216 start_codon:yes stop_codon:yes gene_type:complete